MWIIDSITKDLINLMHCLGSSFWETSSNNLQTLFASHFLLSRLNWKRLFQKWHRIVFVSRAYIERIILTWVVWLEEGKCGSQFYYSQVHQIHHHWRGTKKFRNSQNRHHYLTFKQFRILYNYILYLYNIKKALSTKTIKPIIIWNSFLRYRNGVFKVWIANEFWFWPMTVMLVTVCKCLKLS